MDNMKELGIIRKWMSVSNLKLDICEGRLNDLPKMTKDYDGKVYQKTFWSGWKEVPSVLFEEQEEQILAIIIDIIKIITEYDLDIIPGSQIEKLMKNLIEEL